MIDVSINLQQSYTYIDRDGWYEPCYDYPKRELVEPVIRIPPRTIVVSGDTTRICKFLLGGSRTHLVRGIPFDEFTEEKLAETLEECYKRFSFITDWL